MIEFFGLLRFSASSPSDVSKIEANATGASEMCETCLWKFMEMNVRFILPQRWLWNEPRRGISSAPSSPLTIWQKNTTPSLRYVHSSGGRKPILFMNWNSQRSLIMQSTHRELHVWNVYSWNTQRVGLKHHLHLFSWSILEKFSSSERLFSWFVDKILTHWPYRRFATQTTGEAETERENWTAKASF